MLVIAAGGVRSGSHALAQVLTEIVDLKGTGSTHSFGPGFDEGVASWVCDDRIHIVRMLAWRPALKYGRKKKGCGLKAVVMTRDIRDVVVSIMNFHSESFEDAMSLFRSTEYALVYQQWQDRFVGETLALSYEDFMADTAAAVMQVAGFIGVVLTAREAEGIAGTITQRREQKLEKRARLEKPGRQVTTHVQSGEVDQWRTALSKGQVALSEAEYGDWLVGQGYELQSV